MRSLALAPVALAFSTLVLAAPLLGGCSAAGPGVGDPNSEDPVQAAATAGAVPLPAAQSRAPGPNPGAGFSSPSSDTGVNPSPTTPSPTVPPTVPPTTPSVTPPQSSQPPPAATNADPYLAARDYCVQRINQYRASIGRTPLVAVNSAGGCADQQARYDAAANAAHGAFSGCNEFAQNECPGWGGSLGSALPGCLDAMWREGPGGGHYENMASQQYQYAVCGIYQTPNGSWWVVQDFR